MADETLQVGDGNAGGAQPVTANGQASGDGLSAEQLRAELERVRREAANYRTQRNELDSKVKAFESEKLTEQERLKQQAEQAKADAEAAKAEARTARIESLAAQLGFNDPADAVALVGAADDPKARLDEIAASKPYLLKKVEESKITTPAGNPPRGKTPTAPPFDPTNPPRLTDAGLWKT